MLGAGANWTWKSVCRARKINQLPEFSSFYQQMWTQVFLKKEPLWDATNGNQEKEAAPTAIVCCRTCANPVTWCVCVLFLPTPCASLALFPPGDFWPEGKVKAWDLSTMAVFIWWLKGWSCNDATSFPPLPCPGFQGPLGSLHIS